MISSTPYAIETSDLTKRYKIRETKPGEEQKNRLVKLLVGESFKGRIEVKEKVVVVVDRDMLLCSPNLRLFTQDSLYRKAP